MPVLYADAGDKTVPSLSISHTGTCRENRDDESADLKICSFVFCRKEKEFEEERERRQREQFETKFKVCLLLFLAHR